MQVNDRSIRKKIKQNAYNSFSPLIWLLKIFSIKYNGDYSTSSVQCLLMKSVSSAIIFGALTTYVIYYNVTYVYSHVNVSISMIETVQTIYLFCLYFVDLVFAFRFGRNKSVKYFKEYDRIDQILGVTSYMRIKKRLQNFLIVFITIWLISSSCDFGAWLSGFGWFTCLVCSVFYIYQLIQILTTLDLIAHVMNIEMRLKTIGDLIKDNYSITECCPESIEVPVLINKSCFLDKRTCSENSDSQIKTKNTNLTLFNNRHRVKWLTRCYLMLTEQVAAVNSMYGVRILLNSLNLLIDMVKFTNLAIRTVLEAKGTTNYWDYFPAITSSLRLLICIVIIVSLVSHCEKTYDQRVRIISITDQILIHKNPDYDLRFATMELRELVQERPILFNMVNFFTLNYSLLTSIASIVVTYSIILLQSVK